VRSRHNSLKPNGGGESQAQVRWLRDAASRAAIKGRYGDALDYCMRLEKLQPDEPAWPRRTAYCCQRLGRRGDERAALVRAAKGYERGGFARKAIALYRLAVAIDPPDAELQRHLAILDGQAATGLESLHPPGAQLRAPSEPLGPVSPAVDHAESIPAAPIAGPSRLTDPGEEPLVDEFQLVEFAETEITPK